MNGDAFRLAILFAYARGRREATSLQILGVVIAPKLRVLSALHAMLYGA